MFSWSKKKETRRKGRPEKDSEENEFGVKIDRGQDDKALEAELKRLTGVDNFPEDDLNLNEEEDVETELLRLMGGGKKKKPQKQPSKPEQPLGDISDLTADIDVGDEDVEVDENDTELLGELLDLINPNDDDIADEAESDEESEEKTPNGESDILATIKERLKLYKTAESKAKENNESSRARRFARGIKTLEDLLKKAKAGKEVSPDDIPPVIAINLKPAPSPAPPQSEPSIDSEENPSLIDTTTEKQSKNTIEESGDVLSILLERLKLYQAAETKAKESGETTRARRFNRGIKTLQGLIKDAQAGKPVAAEDIPPEVALNLKPGPPVQEHPPSEENMSDNQEERDEDEVGNISLTRASDDAESKESKESEDQERNIMDVLSERLTMYKTAEAKAKESGETSRARRFARGIKTLQELVRQATAGKPVGPDAIPPVIALNLKPTPVVAVSEEQPREAAIERSDLVRSSDLPERPLAFAPVDDEDVDLDEELEEETPRTVLEGLEQRVRLYSRFRERAREEGNASLADQNERIVRVYLNAIKTFRSGKYVDVEKLPNPRGCPAIPIPFFIP